MAKLSKEQIQAEVETKGYKLLSAEGYSNMSSIIVVQCDHGHAIEVSMADFRRASFECPCCNTGKVENPVKVPEKTGYRVIAFDQATEKFGLSIWDDGKLVFFNLYAFTGALNIRLAKIKKLLEEVIIPEWKPDFIVCEDIQYQYGAVLTYKVLAMLLGIIEVTCTEKGIPYEVVSPNVWRKYAGTCGKTRQEEKMLSVATVRQKYQVNVSDDVAEAILIGSYGAKVHKRQLELAFGKK